MHKPKTSDGSTRMPKIVYSTTDGRQRFPDILQVSYGEKAVIGFDRYGRALGAVVPMEAVHMLAGTIGEVDKDVRERIQRAAQALLHQFEEDAQAVELDQIVESRRTSVRVAAPARPAREKPRRRAG